MRVIYTILTTFLLLAPRIAGSEELELRYPRLREVPASRDVAPVPLPEALKIRDAGAVSRPPADHDAVDIDRGARRAAAETVAHASRAAARGNFEVGFWQGMRRAFDDHYLGEDARAAGFRDGHYDPEAEARGRRLGDETAAVRAEELAAAEVEAQFRDLSREPRPSLRPPVVEPSYDLPRLAAPGLRAVFEATPYGGLHALDPWRVYRCTSARDLYRGRWHEPEAGFRHWEKQQRRGSYWHRYDADEKGRFRVVFLYDYSVAIADRGHHLRRTHRRGYRDGWHHGARLKAEWSYRQGYHEGYGVALSEASARAFDESFPRRYEARYRRLFSDWSSQPRAEILRVQLADASDDGVFEPGEEVLARYEIANYGGAGAELSLLLGSALTPEVAELAVELPRRSVLSGLRPLRLRIPGSTPARTETAIFVELTGGSSGIGAHDSYRVPLRVGYPLELESPVRLLGHDAISGRASLAIGLINRSRRRVPAAATLFFADRRAVGPERPAVALDPGETLELRFEAHGLSPLQLLAGEARFAVEASSGGRLHDRLTYRAPVLATRLQDPALVDYLLALARRGGSPSEVARVHELTLDRLRADWQRAVAADGNPYRRDRKQASAETALGSLVVAWRHHRAAFGAPRVFTELAPKIEALAADLPGAHPFLRSQMKKLARQLG